MIVESYRKTRTTETLEIFSLVCVVLTCILVVCIPNVSRAAYIDTFVSDIIIHEDSTFDNTETIEYIFTEDKHGIFRCIPKIHQDASSSFFKNRYIDIAVTEVQMDSVDVPYTIEEDDIQTCIRIGDPETTITGKHEYVISYTVGGAISYEDFGGAEFYWNVTGNAWEVLMKSVMVNVFSPDQILRRERACYKGEVGKTNSCGSVTEENGIVTFNGGHLNPGEGITIAQSLNRNAIAYDVRERFNVFLFIGIGIICSLIIVSVMVYRHQSRFRIHQTIIP